MLQTLWRSLSQHALCGTALLAAVSLAQAQEPGIIPLSVPGIGLPMTVPVTTVTATAAPPTNTNVEEMKARLDRLEKQNEELLKALQAQPASRPSTVVTEQAGGLNKDEVQKIVGDYLGQRDAAAKAADVAKKADADAKGFTVGSNLGMTAKWNNGLWFESVDKAFRFHVGGRTQFDIVGTNVGDDVQFGKGGIGTYNDGVSFRRGRFAMEGSLWEVIGFNMEWDFINTTQASGTSAGTAATFNTPVPTDLWMSLMNIPFIGTVRIGNHKPWIGFEHLTSSRFLNFMERSAQFDAFIENGNNGFAPGVSMTNTWGSDENGMWGVGIWKTTRAIFGWNTGEGEWSGVGRATWLPIYRDNGRHLLHLGMGAQFADLDDAQVRFRARTATRQAPAAIHNIAAIAQTNGNSQLLLNPELVANVGSFTFQAEYTYSQVYGVDKIIRTPTQTNAAIAKQNFVAQGAYAEVLYFLTGEHRLYNKKNGAFDRIVPNRNYYLVNGENDSRIFQSGAWQVAARYSYLDLNDGPIRGGQLNDVTLGLNWFLNPNAKVQWNYSYGHRSVDAASDGGYHGFGMRFAFDW